MLRFLLLRPIAVCTTLIVVLALSVLAWLNLPVSLMPPLDAPHITVAVKCPGRAPGEVEENFLSAIRETLMTLNGLLNVESVAHSETGTVMLVFKHGTPMDLAYIEVNEKIDRLGNVLPKGFDRPLVMRAVASDIPVLRIHVVPDQPEDLPVISELAFNVLKRRIEQIDGVGLVDLNGTIKKNISITLNEPKLKSLNISAAYLATKIQEANIELGSISVRDGNYRYFLKIAPALKGIADLEKLPIVLPNNGGYLHLGEVANIVWDVEPHQGLHLFQNKPGVVLAVHKQPDSRMPDLMPKLYSAVEQFKADYPQMQFSVTQDQSQLLTLSLQNMNSSLFWGGLFAFAVLFLFMGNWREPLVMGIVLPVSLVLAFSCLWLFGLSLNVISLSGLALGLGMLVDNSVVVIDSIMMKRRDGESVMQSCIDGTSEVMAPLLSSALTNLAVFVPLIFMSGITGDLFFDQALSVAAILLASMFCTFVLVPLMYLMLFKGRVTSLKEDSRSFLWMRRLYHRSFLIMWKYKKASMGAMLLLFPVAGLLYMYLPKQAFPEIARTETIVSVDWSEPIGLDENRNRIVELANFSGAEVSEVDAGFRQYTFGLEQYPVQQASLYLMFQSSAERNVANQKITNWFRQYPKAQFSLSNAPNPFEQVFTRQGPTLEARFRDVASKKQISIEKADSLQSLVMNTSSTAKRGKGFEKETVISIKPDLNKMALFQIKLETLMDELKRLFNDWPVTDLKSFHENTSIVFRTDRTNFFEKISQSSLLSEGGSRFPLYQFIEIVYKEDYRTITADQAGIYQSMEFEEVDVLLKNNEIKDIASKFNTVMDWSGEWFANEENRTALIWIMAVSLLLMYFILTAEFESFTQPFLVLISFPIGLAGGLGLLWLMGESINIMSGIGLVVVLGILDNDAILKIDRINRLRKTLPLEQAIERAGLDRLKPIVMNTLTNVLAITPIIFSSGLGADLQRPVAIATIGGLILATFAAVYFIPLMYWFTNSRSKDKILAP